MMALAITFSGIALFAALAALAATICESKRSAKRSAELAKSIQDLQSGAVPDYEQAKAAARAVNDFNAGISGILGFDPYEVISRKRDNGDGGEGN